MQNVQTAIKMVIQRSNTETRYCRILHWDTYLSKGIYEKRQPQDRPICPDTMRNKEGSPKTGKCKRQEVQAA